MTACKALERQLPSPIWRLTPEMAAVWPAHDAWPAPTWLAAGLAHIVKKGPQRTVLRVDLPGLSFYLKQHHLPNWVTWLRQCLRAPKARREYERLVELTKRRLPVPEPLGWAAGPGWSDVGESHILTRAIEDVQPLHHIIAQGGLSARQRQNLANGLARLLARMHEAGASHRDLHLGNIVVRPSTDEGYELFLVDLDAVDVGAPLDRGRSLANLALFASACHMAAQRTDRLRFLRRYVAERGWLDPQRDRVAAREIKNLVDAIERRAWSNSFAFWARRDQRCLVTNRYYRSVKKGRYVGMAVRGVDDACLDQLCRAPEAMLRESGATLLKHSKTSTVAEILVKIDGVPRPAILKKIGVTRWSDPWTALVRPSPILRSWISGHGFLERGLPTPRPLVMLHKRDRGLCRDGYLITEKIEGAQELDVYVARLSDLSPTERRSRLWRQIERVARAVRDMHLRNVSHRDLKAANLLVTSLANEDTPAGASRPICASPFPVAATNLWFIDLVGVSRHARLSRRRRMQNLARLNASFVRSSIVSRTDRLRFLRIYLAWGVHGQSDWKAWWRGIAAATAAKISRNQRAGRALG